jgi:lipoyl(octanoyl) transferase
MGHSLALSSGLTRLLAAYLWTPASHCITPMLMQFRHLPSPAAYPETLAAMEAHVAAMAEGTAEEQIWLLEHPPLYTGGTSAKASDLLSTQFPVYPTGRGGQYTYHGPGQRVAYAMLNLRARYGTPDVRRYVCQLESWIIATLAEFGIKGERREGRVGIWVAQPPSAEHPFGREDKIAALGIRVRRWISFHGIAINVNPDLSHFGGIVPCGIREHGVTSLAALGVHISMEELDAALMRNFSTIFKADASQNCAI